MKIRAVLSRADVGTNDSVAASPATVTAARQRVLDYNEDDVLATSALRAWLRAQ